MTRKCEVDMKRVVYGIAVIVFVALMVVYFAWTLGHAEDGPYYVTVSSNLPMMEGRTLYSIKEKGRDEKGWSVYVCSALNSEEAMAECNDWMRDEATALNRAHADRMAGEEPVIREKEYQDNNQVPAPTPCQYFTANGCEDKRD